jgi:hypothetical protein
MKIARFRQPAMSALAVLLISGAGIAFAGNGAPSAPLAASAVATPAVEPTTEPVEAADVDTDTLEQGDTTTPDAATTGAATNAVVTSQSSAAAPTVQTAAPTEAPSAGTEAAGTEAAGTEAAGVEEPGDASLPGGGHADDPNDPNADHQFEGVE